VRLFDSGQTKTESVLRYLAVAEAGESDPHLADDVRIAWLTVLHAAAGVSDAWGYSFWWYFGKTYPKALIAWAERDKQNQQELERCAAMVRAEKEQACQNSAIARFTKSRPGRSSTVSIPAKSVQPSPFIQSTGRFAPSAGTASHKMQPPSEPIKPATPTPADTATNLYDSARSLLASLPPKKPATRVRSERKERAA